MGETAGEGTRRFGTTLKVGVGVIVGGLVFLGAKKAIDHKQAAPERELERTVESARNTGAGTADQDLEEWYSPFVAPIEERIHSPQSHHPELAERLARLNQEANGYHGPWREDRPGYALHERS